MEVTITIPDDQVAEWVKGQGWTAENGCELEAAAYQQAVARRAREIRLANQAAHDASVAAAEEAQARAEAAREGEEVEIPELVPLLTTREAIAAALVEVGQYKPCTAEDMVRWGIENLFARGALVEIQQRTGTEGIAALRDDPNYKIVFKAPTFDIQPSE